MHHELKIHLYLQTQEFVFCYDISPVVAFLCLWFLFFCCCCFLFWNTVLSFGRMSLLQYFIFELRWFIIYYLFVARFYKRAFYQVFIISWFKVGITIQKCYNLKILIYWLVVFVCLFVYIYIYLWALCTTGPSCAACLYRMHLQNLAHCQLCHFDYSIFYTTKETFSLIIIMFCLVLSWFHW